MSAAAPPDTGGTAAAELHVAAAACPALADPAAKCAAVDRLLGDWRQRRVRRGPEPPPAAAFDVPGRPPRPRLVPPRELAQRGLGSAVGRAALVHAVAHIEFNAINLALDAVQRFRGLPDAFYDDWLAVAADEARHFGLLVRRLGDFGYAYGDFDAHDGLWEMARRTRGDLVARMALVPRVLEARGLDVTPAMIARLRAAGDAETAGLLARILEEEVAHVAAGTRWYRHACAERGIDPEAHFIALVRDQAGGANRGPHNRTARARAGFSPAELDRLAALASAS